MNSTRTIESRTGLAGVISGGVASGLAIMVIQQTLEPHRTVLRALQENGLILLMAGLGFAFFPLAKKVFGKDERKSGRMAAGMVALAQVLAMGTMMLSEAIADGVALSSGAAGLLAMSGPVAVAVALIAFGLVCRPGKKREG